LAGKGFATSSEVSKVTVAMLDRPKSSEHETDQVRADLLTGA
jgi:hypothetical protein